MKGNHQVTALALLALLGAGCSTGPRDEARVLVLAVSATANEPAPTPSAAVRAAVGAALGEGGTTLHLVLGGDDHPAEVRAEELALRRGDQVEHDAGRRARLTAEVTDRLAAELAGTGGTATHLDPLALLHHIARTPGPGTGVLVASGLQTTGPLATALLGWDRVGTPATTELARQLGLVPDLRGKRVLFSGLGDTAPPQRPLPPQLRHRLVDFWLDLCRAGGAEDCAVDPEPLTARPVATAGADLVPVPEPPVVPAGVPAPVLQLPSDVLFEPDRAVLVPEALPVLRQVAERLPAGARITLTGHTASVGPAASARELSLARAGAVRDGLAGLGIPPDRVAVRGVGFDEPVVVDRDAAGALVPAAAQRNRVVTLVVIP
ncbi:OmpA family protein [Actinokineospora bangkokensis]|uniref:OmpA-like domain-containing protein n=1 Tax=Actinokineospora bangkokensis TaxID=1193682 RepID=A0A1Q9LH61_9PSEU|nr:OmpA family protein [Actinokineospora bangkokensis]OLR91350.1 hypothetical protein BJP25_27200 [Actinokineospora bangkokensis]